MKKRRLGRTELQVGELSLGGAFFTGGEKGFEGSLPVIKRSLELGINLIDTSADYGNSEEALGWALKELSYPPCFVSTKLGPRQGKDHFDPRDVAGLRTLVEESLTLLHRESLDVLMIHEPDRPRQYDWYENWDMLTGPVVDLLEDLKTEGLVKFTGLGGTTVYELTRIVATGRYDVVLTAFNSSPLWREALNTVIPEATKHDMGVFIGSPTQQGWLAERHDDEVKNGAKWLSPPRREQLLALYDLVDESGIELPVLCLRWALGLEGVSTVLTGPRNVTQLEQNFQAVAQGPLPAEVLHRLDEIAAMLPNRPYEEPSGNKLGRTDYRGPGGISY